MWRLIYAIPSWVLFSVFRMLMILLGWVLVPIAALAGAYYSRHDEGKEKKGEFPIVYHFTWGFMYPWDNWDDGIANQMYGPSHWFESLTWKIVYWSCFRNPANNLRLIPYISVKIDPNKIRHIGTFDHDLSYESLKRYDQIKPHWYFCWHGFYSGFQAQFRFFGVIKRFRIGWKVEPKDRHGLSEMEAYRSKGAGFANQFKTVD